MVVVHRNRFVPYVPMLSTHLAVSPASGLVAVARENAVIDLFSLPANFTHFRRLQVLPPGLPVESLCFVQALPRPDHQQALDIGYSPRRDKILGNHPPQYEMLAVAAADGILRIISPRTGLLMCSCDSHGGGAIWASVPLGEGRIAIGCQDGTVKLLILSADARSIELVRVLDKAPSGHVHRLAYCAEKDWLAAGMDDGFVRIINVARGSSISQYKADNIPTALEWSSNGDSLFVGLHSGGLVIIDPRVCQPRLEMRHHIAPIQAIVACGDNDIFVSGMDYRTLHIARTASDSLNWLRAGQRRICHNDVIGMFFCVVSGKPVLIQACVDGSLRLVNPFSFAKHENDRCISGLPVRPIVRSNGSFMAANLGRRIEIWRHGSLNASTGSLDNAPEHVASLKFSSVIMDFDMCDTNVAVLLASTLKVFNVTEKGISLISKIACHADIIRYSRATGQLFYCEQLAFGFRVFCNNEKVASIETSAFAIRMAVGTRSLSVSCSDNSVFSINLTTKNVTQSNFDSIVVALSYDRYDKLMAYTASHNCVVIDAHSKQNIFVPEYWKKQHDALQGVMASPLCAWSEYGICTLGGNDEGRRGKELDGQDPFRSVIHFDFIGPDEAVVVERPWRDVMQFLPAATQVPKYGEN